MIGRARALAFLGSAALHVGAVVAVLALATSFRQAEPLFIDLTGGSEAPGSKAPDDRAGRVAEPGVGAAKAAADTSTAVGSAAATGGRSDRAAASDAPASAGESQAAVGGGGSRLALAGPGAGRSDIPPEFGPYLAGFRQRLQKSLIYPLVARRRGLEGRVEIELVLEPSGRVRDVAVVLSSSYALLDDAAVEAVKSIPPEPLPVQAKRQSLRVRLPVVFQLQ